MPSNDIFYNFWFHPVLSYIWGFEFAMYQGQWLKCMWWLYVPISCKPPTTRYDWFAASGGSNIHLHCTAWLRTGNFPGSPLMFSNGPLLRQGGYSPENQDPDYSVQQLLPQLHFPSMFGGLLQQPESTKCIQKRIRFGMHTNICSESKCAF